MKKDKGIKFETLKKPRLIRNLVILFMITFIGSAIYFKTSSAKYQTTQVIPIINTKVVNKPWWTLTIKESGKEDKVLKSGPGITDNNYTFDYQLENEYVISSFTCTRREGNKVENEIEITIENNKFKITDSAKKRGTVCEVTIRGLLKDKILADNKIKEGEPDLSKTACDNSLVNNENICEDETQNGVYKSEDDYGPTYYYRGSINNNWVKFGQTNEGKNIWWRIIRINGNGSIRLVYAGVGEASEVDPNYNDDTKKGYFMAANDSVGYNTFNTNNYDNAYVGYMYGDVGVTIDDNCNEKCAYQKTHANKNDSDVKKAIDAWYEANLQEEEQYLDGDAGFCGDRSISEEHHEIYTELGYGTNITFYNGAKRMVDPLTMEYKEKPIPTFKCFNKEQDLYTTKGDNIGNKALEHPIGLITADEVAYAGTDGNYNYGYWLYTATTNWTMTPSHYSGLSWILVLGINGGGGYHGSWGLALYIPVINLKSSTQVLSGNGTIDNPYIVVYDQA